MSFIVGCTAHHSSLRPDSYHNDTEKNTAQIIISSPQKIISALLDVIEENFPGSLIRLADAERGKLIFENRSFWRGDVVVTITLKSVTGTDEKGEAIRGYALDITSQGVGFNAAMIPGYAINKINDSLPKVMEEYTFSFATVNNPKVERFERAISKASGRKRIGTQGTGFLLGRLPLVVTNYHIVDEERSVEIVFQDGQIVKGKVIKRDKENDLAIIRFEETKQGHIGFQIFPSYKVTAGQEIFVLGYPMEAVLGEQPSITKGMISSIVGINNDSRHFRITAQINPGNSGGPLLDVQGRVIGIVSHTLNKLYVAKATGHIPEGTNFALKSALLLNLAPDLEKLINEQEINAISADKIFCL